MTNARKKFDPGWGPRRKPFMPGSPLAAKDRAARKRLHPLVRAAYEAGLIHEFDMLWLGRLSKALQPLTLKKILEAEPMRVQPLDHPRSCLRPFVPEKNRRS